MNCHTRVNGAIIVFGETFNSRARCNHLEGLVRDLPKIIWDIESVTVNNLIEATCNNTAASQGMYKESIAKMKQCGDIVILGKKGGKKRSDNVESHDIIIPNKQRTIFSY